MFGGVQVVGGEDQIGVGFVDFFVQFEYFFVMFCFGYIVNVNGQYLVWKVVYYFGVDFWVFFVIVVYQYEVEVGVVVEDLFDYVMFVVVVFVEQVYVLVV